MDSIEHLIPIVVVDFEDKKYDTPDLRFTDSPPIINEAGKRAQKYGIIHSFIKADFERIIEQLFSIGDLMLWLSERAKFFGDTGKVLLDYNEMNLFSLYLSNNPLFNELVGANVVWFGDQDFFEQATQTHRKEFLDRECTFDSQCLLNKIEAMLARAAVKMYHALRSNEIIVHYLLSMGRLKRLNSLDRHRLSKLVTSNLERSILGKTAFMSTYYLSDTWPISGTLFCVVVCEFSTDTGKDICNNMYNRALSYAKTKGLFRQFHEVLVLLVRKDRPDICCTIFPIHKEDCTSCMSEEELMNTRSSFSMNSSTTTEWDFIANENKGPSQMRQARPMSNGATPHKESSPTPPLRPPTSNL